MPTYDFIVIGAGTAGSLLANRLSADRGRRVLLVEAGGRDNYPWIHIPVGYLYCIDNPRTDWRYRTEPEAGLNGRSLIYPRGRTLGGCSSINGMIYMRGQARDYDSWAAATGDMDWSWQRALPDFIVHEDHHAAGPAGRAAAVPRGPVAVPDPAVSDPALTYAAVPDPALPDPLAPSHWHGAGGEWRVEKQRLRWDILDAFAQAAVQAGIPASVDFNRGDNEGVGFFEVNQKRGWRWNTSKAFLRAAERTRPNLTVMTHAQAKRLLLGRDGNGQLRCTGAELVRGHETITVTAAHEVILSAGAIGSPQLLQLSGIGPADLLRHHGVEVQCDLAGVGANLQDHLQIRAVYKVQGVKTLNDLAGNLWGKATIALQYALTRSGPMSMAPSQLGIFTRSRPGMPYPDLQFHVQPLSLPAFGEPLHPFAAFTASVCNLNPTSRGTVRIKSADFLAAPAIAPHYLSTAADRQVAADSLRVVRRIAAQPALARYRPEEWLPGVVHQSDADLARLAGDIGTTIFHPVGTAAMGAPHDPRAVVDSHLRVRGVAGLRVVDASVMPTITSGNPNSPVLMIAEKAARWIAAGC